MTAVRALRVLRSPQPRIRVTRKPKRGASTVPETGGFGFIEFCVRHARDDDVQKTADAQADDREPDGEKEQQAR